MMLRFGRVLAVLGLLSGSSGLSGCHSSGSTTSPDGGVMTPEAYCQGYEAAVADVLARCYGYSRTFVMRIAPDLCASFAASVAAGKIGFDATQAAACLAAPADTCPGEPSPPVSPACAKVTTSLVPVGGSCDDFYGAFSPQQQCHGDAFCLGVGGCEPKGTCTAHLPVGAACDPTGDDRQCTQTAYCEGATNTCTKASPFPKVNEPCDATGLSCDFGLHCDAAKICRAPKPVGAPCVDGECGDWILCRGPEGAKICTLRKQDGAACTPGADECASYGYCGADGKCTLEGVAIGAPCGQLIADGDYVFCADDGYCDGATDQTPTGVCRALKAVGDSCTVTGAECGGHLASCDETTLTCTVCP